MRDLLAHAMQEITFLRRQNELLMAQTGVIEVFAAALGLRKSHGGAEIDVVWDLKQKIAELEAQKTNVANKE
jgi:hypothetical protein